MKNNYKNTLLFIGLAVLLIAIVGYLIKAGSFKSMPLPNSRVNGRLRVTASFYPLYYFASQVAGDIAEVYNITPAGVEPHDFEPTTRDIIQIETGKLLILNGVKLEPWANKIKNDLQKKHVIIITAGDNLARQEMEAGGKTVQDPHVWLSPQLAKQEVENILRGFIEADPNNKAIYEANAQAFQNKLTALHEKYRQGLSRCEKKDIVTSHAAFGYLAKEYGLNQVSISGLSPDEEPSVRKLIKIADFVKKNDIRYIFFETLVSPKLANTIAEEVGAKTLVLNPIEGLGDEELRAEKNYLTEMESNLANLRIALQCQ